jgi:hypothetical protein
MRTRDGTERQDQRHQRRTRGDRVGQERDRDVSTGEPVPVPTRKSIPSNSAG